VLLLLLLPHELARARLERADRRHLVLLGAPPLLVELEQLAVVDDALGALVELLPQLLELALVPPQQRLLVEVLVDARLVLDALGAVGELERRQRLDKGLRRRRRGGG
jgi:hypothetical protein